MFIFVPSLSSQVEECLSLVMGLSPADKLAAVEVWNKASERFQDIVDNNNTSVTVAAAVEEDKGCHSSDVSLLYDMLLFHVTDESMLTLQLHDQPVPVAFMVLTSTLEILFNHSKVINSRH